MKSTRKAMMVPLAAIFLGILSCGPVSQSVPPPPASQATNTPVPPTAPPQDTEPTEPPVEEPAPTEEGAPTEEPAPDAPPSAGTLLFGTTADGKTIDSVIAVSSSGSEVRTLTSGQQIVVPYDWDMSDYVSPDGRYMAAVTTDSADDLTSLWLNLIDIQNGGITPITPLTSEETEPVPSPQVFDDPNFQIVRTLTEVTSVAWSPDSQTVAFMGAMQGPTSDLYTYDVASGQITQLTDGPSEGIRPVFSPDGQWIVHAGVSGLGTGAGFGMQGVWAASIDGSEVNTLYEPDTGDEQWVAWTDPDTLLVYSWSIVCGHTDLRRVNIRTGDANYLWVGFFDTVAYAPGEGAMVVTVSPLYRNCPDTPPVGTYIIGADGSIDAVDGRPAYDVRWAPEAGGFLVNVEEGNLLVSPSGDATDLPAPTDSLPAISPDSQYAWANNAASTGLWVGPAGTPPPQVSADPFLYPTWSPDGAYLFVFDQNTLYRYDPADGTLMPVADDFELATWHPVWVGQ